MWGVHRRSIDGSLAATNPHMTRPSSIPEPTLHDLGEEALIERVARLAPAPSGTAAGPGDDCAVVDDFSPACDEDRLVLLKTDAIVEGIHYTSDADPARVGWKAIARVVSDFAAMGGAPDRFLVTIALPPDRTVKWVDGLYHGMAKAMHWCDGVLAGGETTAVPHGSAAVISVAATGRVARRHLVLRSTTIPGDVLYVTGRLGGSLASGRHLDFHPRLAEAAWLVRHFKPTAMMDLSDGLAADLPKLARAASAGFTIDEDAVPRQPGVDIAAAMNDGEDFELLFTQRRNLEQFETAWHAAFPEVALTRIGEITKPGTRALETRGWNHFQ